ncbi:hypothetical protein OYC64_016328 [Pagothenia borchgrevinki]|uniref:Uncharacterized protein n=1 Tax=Pagothenia borchgrevinki TaxID=8213 RepID=A0ABD2HMU0_PAGBO
MFSGENATFWCRFNRPENFTPTAFDWKVNNTKDVLISRNKGWIDHDAADAQYKHRTSGDLTGEILLVTIFNVTSSDSGNYEGVVIGKLAGHDDPLELNCSVKFIVVKEEQTKRNDSGTPAPPAEEDPAADVWKAVLLGVLIPVAVVVVWILVKRGVIPADVWKAALPCVLISSTVVAAVVWILVKRRVIPIYKKEAEPKTSEGDQQSAAEEGLVGSEVTAEEGLVGSEVTAEEGLVGSEVKDNNNQPSDTVY